MVEFVRPPLYRKQELAIFHDRRLGLIEASTKSGKAQPLDSIIYTPSGRKMMGNIQPGDYVLSHHGKPTRVLAVYPQGQRPIYKITFCDDTSVECDEEHLWRLSNYNIKYAGIISTKELRKCKPWKLRTYYLPPIEPAQFNPTPVPLDPYLLGVLIGDGGQKFIPKIYLYNSAETRIAILQGIMDTDGSVETKYGQPLLEQTSAELADDIEELVQSLGGMVKTSVDNSAGYVNADGRWIQGKTRYRQKIILRDNSICFRLARKKDKLQLKTKAGNRVIKSIEFSRICEAQCIEVEDPSHLYLTNGFVPTHNTHACLIWITEQALRGKAGQNFWWVSPGYSQSDIAFRRLKQGLTKGTFTTNEQKFNITLINGAVIWFRSADNYDALFGEDVYAAVVDEASRVKEEAWFAVRSTLTATRGPIRIIGNVKGRRNWFYQLARRAEAIVQNPEAADDIDRDLWYARITALDAIEAGVTDEKEVRAAKRDLPEHIFRELYEAEAADDGGNPFGIEAIRQCLRPGLSQLPVAAWGIDLARKQDYVVLAGLDTSGHLAAFHRWRGKSWQETISLIKSLVGETTPALVDSTSVGDPILEQLQQSRVNFLGYIFSAPSKQRLMEGLAVGIQSQALGFPDGVLRQELESFEYDNTRTGVRYSAPQGQHDDSVCALALAWHQLTESVRESARPRLWGKEDFLISNYPVEVPALCDTVFAVICASTSDGDQRGTLGMSLWALSRHFGQAMILLDWDVIPLDRNLFDHWLPEFVGALDTIDLRLRIRRANLGIFAQENPTGTAIIARSRAMGIQAQPIPAELAPIPRESLAILALNHIVSGQVKISQEAFAKTSRFNEITRNHWLEVMSEYRTGEKRVDGAEVLLDSSCYAIAMALESRIPQEVQRTQAPLVLAPIH